jgi:hypothetical protein
MYCDLLSSTDAEGKSVLYTAEETKRRTTKLRNEQRYLPNLGMYESSLVSPSALPPAI